MADNGTEMEDLEAMLASDAQGGGDEGEFAGALRGGPTVRGGGLPGGDQGTSSRRRTANSGHHKSDEQEPFPR